MHIGQHQVGSFVRGKPARKADGQRIRRENLVEFLERCGGFVAASSLLVRAAACKVDQLRLQGEVRLPKLAIVDTLNLLPRIWPATVVLPEIGRASCRER